MGILMIAFLSGEGRIICGLAISLDMWNKKECMDFREWRQREKKKREANYLFIKARKKKDVW